jgi:glutaconate CoA-transferase, subunit B
MLRHTPRAFVEKLDFTTSVGDKVRVVVTDLGVLEPQHGELTPTAVHSGVKADDVRGATSWDLRVANDLAETVAPSNEELRSLRALKRKGQE